MAGPARGGPHEPRGFSQPLLVLNSLSKDEWFSSQALHYSQVALGTAGGRDPEVITALTPWY